MYVIHLIVVSVCFLNFCLYQNSGVTW